MFIFVKYTNKKSIRNYFHTKLNTKHIKTFPEDAERRNEINIKNEKRFIKKRKYILNRYYY